MTMITQVLSSGLRAWTHQAELSDTFLLSHPRTLSIISFLPLRFCFYMNQTHESRLFRIAALSFSQNDIVSLLRLIPVRNMFCTKKKRKKSMNHNNFI